MQLSKEECKLLAEEIREKLLKENKIPAVTMRKLKAYFVRFDALGDEYKAIQAKMDKHRLSLKGIIGSSNYEKIRYHKDSLETFTNQLRYVGIPTLESITAKIRLKAVFASEEEMQKFIKNFKA